eukprot:g26848.t2
MQEDSEGANFLMDFVEPCSQGHFTYKPLLAALSAQEPRRREDGPGKPPLGQLPSPEPSPGMGYEDVEDPGPVITVRIVESMDEEGTGVLPVQCWRTILLELGLTERVPSCRDRRMGGRSAREAREKLKRCKSLLSDQRRTLLILSFNFLRHSVQVWVAKMWRTARWEPTRVGMLHTVARNTSICAMTVKPQWEEQGQAASPSHGYPKEASYVEKAPEPESSPTGSPVVVLLKEAQLREHEASHPPVRVLEVVDDVFWQKRGPAIQRLYGQWDCNQLTNQAFQAQMQQVLGNSVDITHPESEFLRLINKHLSARTMKFASAGGTDRPRSGTAAQPQMMSGLRRDAHSTARREGVSVAPSAWSAYEPSEAGTEASAAGRPTNPLAPMSRGGRRHFQLPSENYVLPGNKPAPALGGVPEDQVPQERGPRLRTWTSSGERSRSPCPDGTWRRPRRVVLHRLLAG